MAASKAGILLISESNVTNVLNQLSPACILSTVGQALFAFSQGAGHDAVAGSSASSQASSAALEEAPTAAIQNPLRIAVSTPNHSLLFMPSRLATGRSHATTSIKIVSVPRRSEDKTGLPATTVVFDEGNGQAKAIINARSLTAVRTAAASALALSLGKKTAQARTLLIFGTGLQALWHARLVSAVAPELRRVILAARTINDRSSSLHEQLVKFFGSREVEVQSCSTAEAARAGGPSETAELICCCTPSTEPLFNSAKLAHGASVTLIGSYKPHMQEIDLQPLFNENRINKVIVDSRSACLAEAGELHRLKQAKPELFGDQDSMLPEIGELLQPDGTIQWTQNSFEGDVTVFKCVGMGVMDSSISQLVLEKAEATQQYTSVPF